MKLKDFVKKYNLNNKGTYKIVRGKYKQTKGWKLAQFKST